MLRLEEAAGALTLDSRLARPRVLVVLAAALLLGALASRGTLPRLAVALVAAAALLVVLGGRAVHARVASGRITVRAAVPFAPAVSAPLAGFAAVEVETVADHRRRRAEALARGYQERAGAGAPPWLVRAPSPGTNDQLRRLVLLPAGRGAPLAVTAWLAPDDDLEAARRALEARLA